MCSACTSTKMWNGSKVQPWTDTQIYAKKGIPWFFSQRAHMFPPKATYCGFGDADDYIQTLSWRRQHNTAFFLLPKVIRARRYGVQWSVCRPVQLLYSPRDQRETPLRARRATLSITAALAETGHFWPPATSWSLADCVTSDHRWQRMISGEKLKLSPLISTDWEMIIRENLITLARNSESLSLAELPSLVITQKK